MIVRPASTTALVPARVGLVGNPSDGFGGAVLATVVPALRAEVTARRVPGISIGDEHWIDRSTWLEHVVESGHGDDARIVSAALWTLVDHLAARGRSGDDGVELTWSTSIPLSVGLAGSSALVVATIESASAVWGVVLDRRLVAALALHTEVEALGIAAGWQDRIVQAHRSTVLVDTSSMEEVDGVSVPVVRSVTPPAPIGIVVGWSAHAGASSGDYHDDLRRSPKRHDDAMAALADLAQGAAAAVARGDVDAFAVALDEGWRVRQATAPLRPDHAALVEVARLAGAAATTPGSGGSVVAVPRTSEERERVVAALTAHGCTVITTDLT